MSEENPKEKVTEDSGNTSLEIKSALTTSIIAAFLAISSILNNGSGDDLMTNSLTASDKWSNFQAKSIKRNLLENNLELMDLEYNRKENTPEYKASIMKKITKGKENVIRYKTEQDSIAQDAKVFEEKAEKADKQGNIYDFAEGFYQISIVLAALSLLAKSERMWFFSILLGTTAITLTCVAYFLF